MRALLTSLDVRVSWPTVARLMNLTLTSEALPVCTPCPLCHGLRLTVHRDAATRGHWYHCPDCLKCGDLIHLVAAFWKVGTQVAIDKLEAAGAIERPVIRGPSEEDMIEHYLAKRATLEANFRDFWQDAQAYLAEKRSPVLDSYLTRLGLLSTISKERWLDGPGRLIGGCTKSSAEAIYQPITIQSSGKYNQSQQALFRGPGWKDVLVMPYADLPGRHSGFLFCGRSCQKVDWIHRSLHRANRRRPHEAGLLGLPLLDRCVAGFANNVFAVADPLSLLQWQVHHYATAALPLPLVSWRDDAIAATIDSWNLLANKSITFLTREFNPRILRQLVYADGDIAPLPTVNHEPIAAFKKALKYAIPWQRYLEEWVEEHPDGPVEDLFKQAKLLELPVERLLDACGQQRERVQHLLCTNRTVRTVQVQDALFMERDGMTYVQPANKRSWIKVFDGILRIDRIYPDPKWEKKGDRIALQCVGRLLYRGAEIPWQTTWQRLHSANVMYWVAKQVILAGKGVPEFSTHRTWNKKWLVAVTKFHIPDTTPPDPSNIHQAASEDQETTQTTAEPS